MVKLLSRALVEAINESAYGGDKDALIGTTLVISTISVLKLINESTTPASGFTRASNPSIRTGNLEPPAREFDGAFRNSRISIRRKSRILEFAAKGLADGIFPLQPPLTKTNSNILSNSVKFHRRGHRVLECPQRR